MSKSQEKYLKEKNLGDSVTKTKVSHGKIETVVRVREATTKKDLDLELKRFNLLNEIDKSTVGEKLILPSELQHWQQLILIVGTFNLKSTTEILLACRKLKYSGMLKRGGIKHHLATNKKEYFKFDKQKGWLLTNRGQTEFSRLKQFI